MLTTPQYISYDNLLNYICTNHFSSLLILKFLCLVFTHSNFSFIRSILPQGPVGLNGILRSGDEILEVI